jgi:anti-sigma B factor antagonist
MVPMALSLNTRTVRGVMIVEVTGRLNAGAAADHFRNTLDSAVDAGNNKLVLDVSGVGYVDSTGIEALVGIYQKANNASGGLRILKPDSRLRQLLNLTKLADVLGVVEDETEAIDALAGRGDEASGV